MAAGKAAGALGFGTGVAKGIALGLMRQQQEKREDERLAEDRDWKQYQMAEPMFRQQAIDTGDWGGYVAFTEKYNPETAKLFKKEGGNIFQNLAPILAPKGPQKAQAPAEAPQPAPGFPTSQGWNPETPATIPDRGPAVGTFVPEKPRWTFGGSPLDTPEAKQQRAESQLQGQIAIRRKVAQAEGLTGERLKTFILTGEVPNVQAERVFTPMAVGKAIAVGDLPPGAVDPEGQPVDPSLAEFWQPMRTRAGEIAYMPGAAPTATTTNLPATLRERVEELRSVNPTWDDAQLRQEAAKSLITDRAADREAKEASAESLKASRESAAANRALQAAILRMTVSAGGLTPNQVVNETSQLRDSWQKLIQPIVERQEAVARVDSALTALDRGDRLAAVDAILVAFQKLNDERTGVREGEVNRIMAGLGLPSRISGAITQLQKNGAAIPDAEIRGLARLAKDTARQMDQVRGQELKNYRDAVEQSIKPHGIDPARVFGSSPLGRATQSSGAFTMTLDGKSFTFPTQAAADAFKRQFPNAK